MINSVVIVGRLARDPELRYTSKGDAVASFSVAVDKWGKDAGADFFDVVAWKQSGEFIAQYGAKGRVVGVRGRLSTRTYETQEKQRRKVVEIVADEVRLLDKPKDDGGSNDAADDQPF